MATRLYDEQSVTSRSELNETMGIDASVSARGLWGKAGGAASYFKGVKMSAESFYWLVHANYTLADESIDMASPEFRLTPAAVEILHGPGGLEAFRQACGDYFFSGVVKGATYALLYEFSGLEARTVERLRASASYEGWGVEAAAAFSHTLEMAERSASLRIHAAGEGGSARLAAYAKDPAGLEQELATLRADLEVDGRGVAKDWFISDYNMFPEVQALRFAQDGTPLPDQINLLRLRVDRALATFYDEYAAASDYEQRLRAHLDRARGELPLITLAPTTVSQIEDRLIEVEAHEMALADRATQCMGGDWDACQSGDLMRANRWLLSPVRQEFPPLSDYTTLQGWQLGIESSPDDPHHWLIRMTPPDIGGSSLLFSGLLGLSSSMAGIIIQSQYPLIPPTIIGNSLTVADPDGGQDRTNMCVYNYSGVCFLRFIPGCRTTPADASEKSEGPAARLQIVILDPSTGFTTQRLDLPVVRSVL